jgi:hypothetical protein
VHAVRAKPRAAARVSLLVAAMLHSTLLVASYDPIQVQMRIEFPRKRRHQHCSADLPRPSSCRHFAVRFVTSAFSYECCFHS